MTDTVLTKQDIRNKAVAAELAALRAQSAAINALDTEHAFALEHTFQSKRILARVEALVARCQELQDSMPMDEAESLAAIEEFRRTADAIKESANDFDQFAETNASGRKERALDGHELMAPGSRELATGAGESCWKAEIRQFESFALQVSAICNLCTELLYNAASGSVE